ncbi:WYL domain-containing protein [Micromonospora sp. 4G57]|uniref:WYL domain-containing protein n=1 Tax=Micromonospora sicca TaxID=2202420 RepID=A0ABU5J8U4_9ACTN|nr:MULTISPECIES: WYL domain-containing protein [unclassified Micromonospora]MDZ5443588.1 WYL domain-containing protein [Micromonospora sp. 4G57]MDZ5488939.1 WYL domain-containing protein [Micromonospora sp. 4G53]
MQRDVEALLAAGIPVRSTRGPAGGYRLDRGYRTRLTGVGLDEAGALAFLGLADPAEQLGLGGMLEGARMKVWASLTGEARERAYRKAARFHLDPVRWYGTPEPVPCLTQLGDAVWRDRRVRLRYVRDGRATTRKVDPLGLVLAAGDWHLVALRDGGRHTYRASRSRSQPAAGPPPQRCSRCGQPISASFGSTSSPIRRVYSTECRSGVTCPSVTPSAEYSATSAGP